MRIPLSGNRSRGVGGNQNDRNSQSLCVVFAMWMEIESDASANNQPHRAAKHPHISTSTGNLNRATDLCHVVFRGVTCSRNRTTRLPHGNEIYTFSHNCFSCTSNLSMSRLTHQFVFLLSLSKPSSSNNHHDESTLFLFVYNNINAMDCH